MKNKRPIVRDDVRQPGPAAAAGTEAKERSPAARVGIEARTI